MPVIADSSNAGISSPGITLGVSAVTTVSVATSTDTVVTALTPSVIPGDEIPAFDESAITGIYRDIVDAATNGTTIPRQFELLAARVHLGAMLAVKISL